MPSVLESHLALLEREAQASPPSGDSSSAERTQRLEELVALHAGLYELLERRITPGGIAEVDRRLVPMFRRWLDTARQIVAEARDLRRAGQALAGTDGLVRAINRAKPLAEDFDEVLRLNDRLARDDAGSYKSLAGVVDALRVEAQPPR